MALSQKRGTPLGLGMRLKGLGTARQILLDRRMTAAVHRQLDGQGTVLPKVIADHAQPARAKPRMPGQLYYAVFLLGRMAAVEAQGAVACRQRILWQGHAVEEQDDAMQRGRLRIRLDTPADAFLGQQAGHEIHIRLAVLSAVVTRRQGVQAGPCIIAPVPAGTCLMLGEHGIHDLPDGCVTEDAAVALLAQPPGPCRQAYTVAGEFPITVQPTYLAHQPCPWNVAPLRITRVQRCRPAQPLFAGTVRVRRKYIDVVIQTFRKRLASVPALHHQSTCSGQFKPVQQRCILMRMQRVHMTYTPCTTLAHFCAQDPSNGMSGVKSECYECGLERPGGDAASPIPG